MATNRANLSLLPYLRASGMRLSLAPLASEIEATHPAFQKNPFQLISDNDPLAHLLAARCQSDAGSSVREICLLVQKDRVDIASRALRPLSNPDIDLMWQRLGRSLQSDEKARAIWFAGQIDDEGALVPWNPIFYCRTMDVFFEPVCPSCGGALEVCRDDAVLANHGLYQYTETLRRYLFCPSCHEENVDHIFFVPDREINDPGWLQDRHDLLTGIGQLVRRQGDETGLPCQQCDQWQSCFENERLVHSRVCHLSFFPFFMVALKMPDVHVLDFLPLLAGAQQEEVCQPLRQKGAVERARRVMNFAASAQSGTRMFFENQDRHFVELLYLKMVLLEAISQSFFRRSDSWHLQDLNLDIEHFWVRIPEQARLLPQFWNLDLQIIGVGAVTCQEDRSAPISCANGLYPLGLIWLHVLVVNHQQDFRHVHSQARALLDQIKDHGGRTASYIQAGLLPDTFSPRQIFWHPHGQDIPDSGRDFWCQSLGLAFDLLRYALDEAASFSPERFREKLLACHHKMREDLFARPPAETPDKENHGPVLREIVLAIRRKWQAAVTADAPIDGNGLAAPSRTAKSIGDRHPAEPLDDILKETVVLKAADFAARTRQFTEPRKDLPETVIFKPDEQAPVPSAADCRPAYDDMAETVIIQTGDDAGSTPPEQNGASNDMPETIVARVPGAHSAEPPEGDGEDAPPATVIVRHPDADGATPPPRPQPADDIPETIVVRPANGKGGHRPDSVAGPLPPDGRQTSGTEPPETIMRRLPDDAASKAPDRASSPEDLPETVVVEPRKPGGSPNDSLRRNEKGKP